MTDTSSCLSSTTSDEISTDPDPSESDDLSNTYGPGDEGEVDEDIEDFICTPSVDDDDDEDSFEVLSFKAPPESTIYIKGSDFHISPSVFIHSFSFIFRISMYHTRKSE